jgi:hypothetical protein
LATIKQIGIVQLRHTSLKGIENESHYFLVGSSL